jgi:hypothetical protein
VECKCSVRPVSQLISLSANTEQVWTGLLVQLNEPADVHADCKQVVTKSWSFICKSLPHICVLVVMVSKIRQYRTEARISINFLPLTEPLYETVSSFGNKEMLSTPQHACEEIGIRTWHAITGPSAPRRVAQCCPPTVRFSGRPEHVTPVYRLYI